MNTKPFSQTNQKIELCCENLSVRSINRVLSFNIRVQSEYPLWKCLTIKELLTRDKLDIWKLSACSETQTNNHLFCEWTLNDSAKLAKIIGLCCVLWID